MLLKFGWLFIGFGAFALLPAAAVQAAPGRVLFAGGKWAGIDFGARCEARSGALWARTGTRPFAGFAFGGGATGRFYVHLARPARAGASVIATIESQPFLLAGRGQWAWGRGGDQQRALLNAVRYGQSMRVEARDSTGRRIVDRYSLAGAATAIDAAAAACAGKSAPR
ncbi:hypothetical protein H8M03_06900 [Sphingomonas sabuli]|uniref:Uncharacterized protein n=1 Tax=Sphingomonas sabuli TaxID=2764186 RepID=A0A7G9KZJ4_9SPHN|nr:hypothetical protein [Sphingomonas sabuli]QNM81793.1 hypothetical protein H8M03_06900 [Sphingomonas sabuli]